MRSTKVEDFKVVVPGGRVFATRWMPESGSKKSPIILLHDSLGSVDLWSDFPLKLAENLSRCVVAYD